MPSPKTPQEIMEEWRKESYGYDVEYPVEQFLRSSMQSLLLHVKGEMPEKKTILEDSMSPLERIAEVGRWGAIDDVRAVLDREIERLTKES